MAKSEILLEVRPVLSENGGKSLTYVAIGASPHRIRVSSLQAAVLDSDDPNRMDLIAHGRLLFVVGTVHKDTYASVADAIGQIEAQIIAE